MEIITVLIMISLCIAIIFLLIFYWSMKSGQFDDTYTPSVRMLFEDKKKDKDLKKNPQATADNQK